MKSVVLIGAMGCGKGTDAEYLVAHDGYTLLTFSSLLREEGERRGMEPTVENYFKVHDTLQAEFGMDILAKRAVERARELKLEKVLFDGPRYPEMLARIVSEVPGTILLGIVADDDVRLARVNSRKRSTDPNDQELVSFMERDKRLTEKCLEFPGVIRIDNNGTLSVFEQAVAAVVN